MRPCQNSCKAKKRAATLYGVGAALFFVSIAFGLLAGSSSLSPTELLRGLFQGQESAAGQILFLVRLPRIGAALLCGAALAVSGCVIQNVLANPLASPTMIGTGAGAGLAVTLCAAFEIYSGVAVSFFAFLGAFLSVMGVSLIAAKFSESKTGVILIGVAVNALLGAMSDAVVSLNPDVGIFRNDFKIGDFSFISANRIGPAALFILLALGVLLMLSVNMDVLSLGEENAAGLGMKTGSMRTLLLLLSAVLAGCAVSLCGLLSFVGLVVPHAVRKLWKGVPSLHLLLLSTLYGAGFVTLCDTVARTAFAPFEIPVGIIMAFLGAPFFLYLLSQKKGGKAL